MKRVKPYTIAPRLPAHLNHPFEPLMVKVLARVDSPHPREGYQRALTEFLTWHAEQAQPPLTPALLQRFQDYLADTLRPASINQRLKAIQALLHVAVEEQALSPTLGANLIDRLVPQAKRTAKALTFEQVQSLLAAPDTTTLQGQRDVALLAVAFGCGLRRNDLVRLTFEQLQHKGGQWVIANLPHAYSKRSTIVLPAWAKQAVNAWAEAAALLPTGYIFRPVQAGAVLMGHLPPFQLHEILNTYAEATGVAPLHPVDVLHTSAGLRRQSRKGVVAISLDL